MQQNRVNPSLVHILLSLKKFIRIGVARGDRKIINFKKEGKKRYITYPRITATTCTWWWRLGALNVNFMLGRFSKLRKTTQKHKNWDSMGLWWFHALDDDEDGVLNLHCNSLLSKNGCFISLLFTSKRNHRKLMQRLTCGYWPIRRRWRWWSWRFCVQFKLPLHLWHNLSASNFHRMGNFGGFLKRELQQQESRSRRDVKQKTQVGCWFEFYGATGIAHLMLKFYIKGRGGGAELEVS